MSSASMPAQRADDSRAESTTVGRVSRRLERSRGRAVWDLEGLEPWAVRARSSCPEHECRRAAATSCKHLSLYFVTSYWYAQPVQEQLITC